MCLVSTVSSLQTPVSGIAHLDVGTTESMVVAVNDALLSFIDLFFNFMNDGILFWTGTVLDALLVPSNVAGSHCGFCDHSHTG